LAIWASAQTERPAAQRRKRAAVALPELLLTLGAGGVQWHAQDAALLECNLRASRCNTHRQFSTPNEPRLASSKANNSRITVDAQQRVEPVTRVREQSGGHDQELDLLGNLECRESRQKPSHVLVLLLRVQLAGQMEHVHRP
jgi:hypothetical protein